MIKEKDNKSYSTVKLLRKVFAMIIAVCPVYFILNTLISTMSGFLFGANTVATQQFFDKVSEVVGNSNLLREAFLAALILALVIIITQIMNGVGNFLSENMFKKIIGVLAVKLNAKAEKIDPAEYESPELLNSMKKSSVGMYTSIGLVLTITTLIFFYIPYFIFMGAYLYKLKPILAVSIVLIFIPVLLSQIVRVKVFANLEDESAPLKRQYEYYEKCMVDREFFKETRGLGAFNYFRNLYKESLDLLNKKVWQSEKKTNLIEFYMKLITLSGYIGVLYLFFISLMKGDISVGAFGAIFASIDMMFAAMEEIICGRIAEVSKGKGSTINFIKFLEWPERLGEDIEIKGVPEIKIEDISFKYPNSENESLKNISFNIKNGETIAIVGENGAGKSTLVKSIIGLYRPIKGRVLINDIDTKKISNKSLYKGISTVFQDYRRYKMNLEDNISISSFEKMEKNKNNKKELDEAVLKSGLIMDDKKFNKGYDTMLSREFDGVDLSGGQWQRIAIARGFYKFHNMIVLDEPTAAIDPVEESRIYEKFKEMSKGKTSIIVTHRLGSAKIADRIVVMDSGQVVEIGTHDELMRNNKKYKSMYEAQSKWYVR